MKAKQSVGEINKEIEKLDAVETGQISDGFHSFDELYAFRTYYNACLFNEWARQGKYDVHKSVRNGDGDLCFGGHWFVVVATLPNGQISNHYHMDDWKLFDVVERYTSAPWDGHTAKDVMARLREFLL